MRERGGWRGREDEGVEGVLGYYEHLQVDLVDAAKKGIGDEGVYHCSHRRLWLTVVV